MNRIAGQMVVVAGVLLTVIVGSCFAADREWPDQLENSAPLTLVEPLDVVMVRGISQFAENKLQDVVSDRDERWNRDYSSPDAYRQSVAEKRNLLRSIIGAVDELVPVRVSAERRDLLRESPARPCALAVSWSVLEGVMAEGLLVLPQGTPKAAVVLLPDATWPPEQLVRRHDDATEPYPLAAWLAANDCMVLLPTLVSRGQQFANHPDIRSTNLSHREFVYRMAFEMGRHIIGYEVQKVLAAADYLQQHHPSLPTAVCGIGDGGLLAMYSAALDEQFEACLVSGYFQERDAVWSEPIDRNVWNLLSEFGDANIASLVAPRRLIIEACRVPETEIPTQVQQPSPKMAAPGKVATAPIKSVRAEFARAAKHFERLEMSDRIQLIISSGSQTEDGRGDAFTEQTRQGLLEALGITGPFVSEPFSIEPPSMDESEHSARQKRQVEELVRFTQRLLHRSDKVRAKFWEQADRSSVEKWVETAAHYRDYVHENMIGKLPPPTSPPNPRTRKIFEEPTHVGYEVLLDVYPPDSQSSTLDTSPSTTRGVVAGGILLIPQDVQEGEQRPVVVFQHGLEGTPMDTITTDETTRAWQAYKGVSTQLVERGYIVYAPQNPYRGEDDFRVIQRKSNPMGRSLFSYIIEQHRQTLRWLATLPWVDAERIAFYGLSYGGKTAVRVPPLLNPETLDTPSYCLSICSADFNEWIRKNVSHEDRYSYVYTREYEMFEWNMGHVAGYAELATLMTPRPFMVERGHNDGVAPDEWVAWEFAKVRRHYDQLGLGDRAKIEFFDGPHTINGKGTFAFLDRHLDWRPQVAD